MVKATATPYEPIPSGVYKGKLLSVEEKTNDTGSYWAWAFRLTEDIEGYEVPEKFEKFTAVSSTNFMPKSKARGWVNSMIARTLRDDEEIDFDEAIVGRNYILTIAINPNGRNTLEGVSPAKRAPRQEQDEPAVKRVDVPELTGADEEELWAVTPA